MFLGNCGDDAICVMANATERKMKGEGWEMGLLLLVFFSGFYFTHFSRPFCNDV